MKQDLDKLYYRLQEGRLSRRTMNNVLWAAGFAYVVTRYGSGRAMAQDSCGDGYPTMFTWAGYNVPEFLQPFIKKHGCMPNFAIFGDEEEAFAKLRAGFKPQLMYIGSYKVHEWAAAGLLEPIDTSRLSNYPDLIPSLTTLPEEKVNGERYYVPQDWGQTSVTFRTDLAPEYVPADKQSWGILWDPKYKGRLSMIDSLIDGVAVASIYAGVKDPFNLTNPADMAKVKAVMEKQRPLLRFYSNDMTSIQQALASGELVAADTWNDSFLALRQQGLPVGFMHPKEGLMTWIGGCVRHAGDNKQSADMVQLGYEVIDAYLSPETGKAEIMEFGYGHANRKAFDLVSEKDLEDRGLSRNPEAVLSAGIFQSSMVPQAKIQAMYEDVKAGM